VRLRSGPRRAGRQEVGARRAMAEREGWQSGACLGR